MVKIYRNAINYGIAKSKNICIKLLEKYNVNLFCLLDDDIFIKKSPYTYIIDIFKKLDIPLLTNYHTDAVDEHVTVNNIKLVEASRYFGNLLVIQKKYLDVYGYFNVFPGKWGCEHIEITKRYLKNTGYNDICGNFDDYICNYNIINGVNTLDLHSLQISAKDTELNVKKMEEYLKEDKYVDFDNDYLTDRIL
jgi:hypothetical protein